MVKLTVNQVRLCSKEHRTHYTLKMQEKGSKRKSQVRQSNIHQISVYIG